MIFLGTILGESSSSLLLSMLIRISSLWQPAVNCLWSKLRVIIWIMKNPKLKPSMAICGLRWLVTIIGTSWCSRISPPLSRCVFFWQIHAYCKRTINLRAYHVLVHVICSFSMLFFALQDQPPRENMTWYNLYVIKREQAQLSKIKKIIYV